MTTVFVEKSLFAQPAAKDDVSAGTENQIVPAVGSKHSALGVSVTVGSEIDATTDPASLAAPVAPVVVGDTAAATPSTDSVVAIEDADAHSASSIRNWGDDIIISINHAATEGANPASGASSSPAISFPATVSPMSSPIDVAAVDTNTESHSIGIISVPNDVDSDSSDTSDDLAFNNDDIELGNDDDGGPPAAAAASQATAPVDLQTTTALSAILARIETMAKTSDVDVEEVDEPAAVPSGAAKKPNHSRLVESIKRKAAEKGVILTDGDVDDIVATRTVQPGKGKQRQLPKWATPQSAEILAWRGPRTIEQLEGDCLKALRRDGGILGPVKLYEKMALGLGATPEVAERIARAFDAHQAQRVFEMRVVVGVTFNQERLERALAAALNPAAVRYLRVKGD